MANEIDLGELLSKELKEYQRTHERYYLQDFLKYMAKKHDITYSKIPSNQSQHAKD